MSASTPTARTALPVPLPVIIIAGCIIAMVTFGARSTSGLFMLPMTEDLGWSRNGFAMALAVQNLVWGITQPFAGGFADKFGTARTLAVGALIYAAGLLLWSITPNEGVFLLTGGVLMGIGIGTASFGVVMAAFGRAVPANKRSFVFGIATAASSMGQFVFAPLGQAFISNFGWQMALVYLGLIILMVVPLSFMLRGQTNSAPGDADMPFMQALSKALGHGSYRLLVIGFFVCGFHLAFITVHFPAFLVQCGLTPEASSWALGLIGLFNVAGSLLAGWLGDRLPKQILLSAIYLLRAIGTAAFLLLPITEVSAYIYAATLGMLWLATVPLTAGLVSLFFGPRYMGMLYGVAFLSHQIGSFFGVWLGGVSFDLTGSYDLVWYLGILIGLFAAAIHIPIREVKAPAFVAPAPSIA
ncbi:MFS transporter [Pelagibacterium luteolum]|uniref:Predicted arabinose efflux permease, MFS family n=1 Tax=Pelagibacterium luteolum TaxID=440168 RepID=A0A1G7YCV1_9HYPH|nr:MFS transporter [Pelagibacterium luteolum]SDG94149.1 Predicted arabinose efflux permease, MFS family [Pelagibacterium luteolum]